MLCDVATQCLERSRWSIGNLYLRAWFCCDPVRKPWGKYNPPNQNTFGGPMTSQLRIKSRRATRSSIQLARGFSDGYATPAQFAGTWLLSIAVYCSSSSSDISTSPRIARWMSSSVASIFTMMRLYRTISCFRAVPIESRYSPRITKVTGPASSSRIIFGS